MKFSIISDNKVISPPLLYPEPELPRDTGPNHCDVYVLPKPGLGKPWAGPNVRESVKASSGADTHPEPQISSSHSSSS